MSAIQGATGRNGADLGLLTLAEAGGILASRVVRGQVLDKLRAVYGA